jgi:multiple sugar transport system permease protein
MAPPAAAALAFVVVFNPRFGPVNQILGSLGVDEPPLWFYGPGSSKWGLVLLALWGVGDAMIIFLAGLLDVPRQLYEAADIEGASGRQKFRHITLPMISPVIFFSLVIGVIYGFQLFTQAYVVALAVSGSSVADSAQNLGSPQGSMLFFSVYLFEQGFLAFRMGYASALAWVLFFIAMVCTLALIKGSRRWVHYQGGGFR